MEIAYHVGQKVPGLIQPPVYVGPRIHIWCHKIKIYMLNSTDFQKIRVKVS